MPCAFLSLGYRGFSTTVADAAAAGARNAFITDEHDERECLMP